MGLWHKKYGIFIQTRIFFLSFLTCMQSSKTKWKMYFLYNKVFITHFGSSPVNMCLFILFFRCLFACQGSVGWRGISEIGHRLVDVVAVSFNMDLFTGIKSIFTEFWSDVPYLEVTYHCFYLSKIIFGCRIHRKTDQKSFQIESSLFISNSKNILFKCTSL